MSKDGKKPGNFVVLGLDFPQIMLGRVELTIFARHSFNMDNSFLHYKEKFFVPAMLQC